jgi:uncharacterized protein YciI
MKSVVIGEPSGATMEMILAVYPRHKAVVDAFVANGDLIGIGPFVDLGNMAIFRTREAAEAFTSRTRSFWRAWSVRSQFATGTTKCFAKEPGGL